MKLHLMPHQMEVCADYKTPYLGLIGGFGCGKTKAFCYKTVIMAGLNVGYEGAVAEPTNYLSRTHLIPNLRTVLEEMGVPHEFEKSLGIFHLHFAEGSTKIYVLSGENYERLVGYNLAFFGSDETDTSPHEVAKEMWNKAISRVRWGPHRQIYTTSTPEGYRFLHEFFALNASPDRRAIHASSYDNPLLDREYLEAMKAQYTEAQWRVWALGQFGTLNSSLVYSEFDRQENHSDLVLANLPRHQALHVGMDFNIDHMAAVVHALDDHGDPVAIEELVELKNVPAMIDALQTRYRGRPILVYPDASGANRNPAGLTTSISQLRQAGFKVIVDASNPAVGDRINSMNAMFKSATGQRRYKVNTRFCPFYTSALEQQAWVKGSHKDDKRDHVTDAAGYFIWKMFPLKGRPRITQH